MSVSVRIPTVLRQAVDGHREVQASGRTIREILESVGREYPAFADRITGADGELRPFLNIFLNGTDIRFQDDLDTGVDAGDEISIVPSIAGG